MIKKSKEWWSNWKKIYIYIINLDWRMKLKANKTLTKGLGKQIRNKKIKD
jgi:hypothetical protein